MKYIIDISDEITKGGFQVRPEETLLKDIDCENCGAGYVIETGQVMES